MQNLLIMEIDEYVRFLGKSRVKAFYPIEIVKALDLPLDVVIERLNYLVIGNSLKLKYDIKCEECSEIIDIVNDYREYIGKEVYCEECMDYIVIEQFNIFPVYYFTSQYKEMLLKKNSIRSKIRNSNDLILV